MSAANGCGVESDGPVAVSLGTSGTVFAYRGQPAVDPVGEAAAFCDSTGAWLPLAATLNCTSATEWVRELFAMDHSGVDATLASGGAAGVTVPPYPPGEPTPDPPTAAPRVIGPRPRHSL